MDLLELSLRIVGLMTLEAGLVLPEVAAEFDEAALAALNARCPEGAWVTVADLKAVLLQADIEACVEALQG